MNEKSTTEGTEGEDGGDEGGTDWDALKEQHKGFLKSLNTSSVDKYIQKKKEKETEKKVIFTIQPLGNLG